MRTWKGYLKLSLVSCPVKLYPATSSTAGKISFNLLHKDTLNRVQQKYHDPELGEIDRADLVKGYQFEKDRYVVVTDEELEEIEIESSKTIDIDGFVDAGEIDPIYFDSTYYLAPDGPIAEETFGVILEAMKEVGKVAVARIVLSGRERQVGDRADHRRLPAGDAALGQGDARAVQRARKAQRRNTPTTCSRWPSRSSAEGDRVRARGVRGSLRGRAAGRW